MKETPTPEPPAAPTTGTDDQTDAIRAWAEHYGESRKRTFRKDFNEADFICGAMSALFALGRADRIPPMWVFGPLSGRPVFGPEPWIKPPSDLEDGDENAE